MNVELAQAATVFDVLCVRLQRLWLLLMAVYRLGNISTQITFWKMISMQFVQVRSQNRSVPSRGGKKVWQKYHINFNFLDISRFNHSSLSC